MTSAEQAEKDRMRERLAAVEALLAPRPGRRAEDDIDRLIPASILRAALYGEASGFSHGPDGDCVALRSVPDCTCASGNDLEFANQHSTLCPRYVIPRVFRPVITRTEGDPHTTQP